MVPTKTARIVLTDVSAIVSMLVIGSVVAQRWHVPAGLSFMQLLAIELFVIALPTSIIAKGKAKKADRHHFHVKAEIVLFGLISAGAAYLAYFMYFAGQGLSPVFIDTTGPFFLSASSISFITFALCQLINLMLVSADEQKNLFANHLWDNKKLNQATLVSIFLLLNAVYNPLLRPAFNLSAVGFDGWLIIVLAVTIYGSLRLLQRQSRKHTRHAVVKLHREIHKA
jgi:magnesium-transporting ATPase (P-type)